MKQKKAKKKTRRKKERKERRRERQRKRNRKGGGQKRLRRNKGRHSKIIKKCPFLVGKLFLLSKERKGKKTQHKTNKEGLGPSEVARSATSPDP